MHAFQLAMFALLIPALMLFLAVFLLIFRGTRTKAAAPAIPSDAIYEARVPSRANLLEGRA
jgi:hypothetical protein